MNIECLEDKVIQKANLIRERDDELNRYRQFDGKASKPIVGSYADKHQELLSS
jgi:hypothetical protein